MRSRYAFAAAVICGTLAGAVSYVHVQGPTGADVAFAQRAARHLLAGRDPYRYMSPGTPAAPGAFLYPLPAAVVTVPLAALTMRQGAALFMAASTFALAFALARRGAWALLALASPPFLLSVWATQWPPVMVAAAMLSGLGWLSVVKPNLGLVGFLYRPRWGTVVGGLALVALSFLLVPTWPLGWLRHVRAQETAHLPAILWPLGAVGLVGLLRWRLPEGRLLSAMTLIPTSTVTYDFLFLWLIPQGWREALTLTATSWLGVLAIYATAPNDLTHAWTRGHLIAALALIVPSAWMVWRRNAHSQVTQ